MNRLKGLIAIFIGVLLLCYAANIHTTTQTQAARWDGASELCGDVASAPETAVQISYGGSTKQMAATDCDCSPDQKCGDCEAVLLFSAVYDLKQAIHKSQTIDTVKRVMVNALQDLCTVLTESIQA